METGYTVMDVMTTRPLKVEPGTLLLDCAKLMKKERVGSLIVQQGDALIGILTEADMVRKVAAENVDVSKTKVEFAMTSLNDMTTIDPRKDIFSAIKLMNENDVRRLPVVEGGKLLGLITMKDILKIEPTLFEIISEKIELREQERKLSIYGEEDSE